MTETASDHETDHATDNRAGGEIRKPMDGHRNAQTDVKGVGEREQLEKPLFREKCHNGDGHGEGDGGVRRRPAPENAAAIKSEPEFAADVVAHDVRWVNATGKEFVNGGNEPADEGSLSNREADAIDSGISKGESDDEHCDGHEHRQKHSGEQRKMPPAMSNNISGGDEIRPIESGQDEHERKRDGKQMPKNQPAFETAKNVMRQRRKEMVHTDYLPRFEILIKNYTVNVCLGQFCASFNGLQKQIAQ